MTSRLTAGESLS